MEAFLEEFRHLKVELEEIKSATANFHEWKIIGKGGFGIVYKGELSHSKGRSTVAFKRLNRKYGQGDMEFWKEILMLSRYTHENLIPLLGFCSEDGEKILVYEHAHHGSLDRHLNNTVLTWRQRLKICVAAAKGLNYLHDPKETQQRVLHRDIKSSNILLDENWNAKISDMGLSKIGPANQQYTFLVTNVVGTPGYIDPLYMETYSLTKESDVYSFGVVLFEVLCGRLCFEYNNGRFQSLVPRWKQCYKLKTLDWIIFEGPNKRFMDPSSLKTFSDIPYLCLHKSREERPKMSHVVEKLEFALRFQENSLAARLDFGKSEHGCEYYRRRCKLRAPCCNKVFCCHHCHNKYTSELNDPEERHKIVLKDVTQVVCMICKMEQPVGKICSNCGVKMGEYFCGICKLFDDDTSKHKFHCYDCGICRRGSSQSYYHCHKCGCCYVKAMRGAHTCVENCMKNDCPLCREYLFDSIKRARLLYCGHGIHKDCYNEMLQKYQSNCRICSKPFSFGEVAASSVISYRVQRQLGIY